MSSYFPLQLRVARGCREMEILCHWLENQVRIWKWLRLYDMYRNYFAVYVAATGVYKCSHLHPIKLFFNEMEHEFSI